MHVQITRSHTCLSALSEANTCDSKKKSAAIFHWFFKIFRKLVHKGSIRKGAAFLHRLSQAALCTAGTIPVTLLTKREPTACPQPSDKTAHTTLGSAKTEGGGTGLVPTISRVSPSPPWNPASDWLSLRLTKHHSPKWNQTRKGWGINPFPPKNLMWCVF